MFEQPFAIPSLALFILAIPLVFNAVPRNRFYGVRTRRALSNDQAWKRINRVGGIAIMIASVVYGTIALACPYDRRASSNFLTWSIHLIAFVVPLVIGISVAVRYAREH
jgi:uncharacterized membrane protein